MSDVCVHLIHWVLGRGNEHEFPRAGITLMTLRAALCAVTFDLCSSSLTKKHNKRNTHACTHTDSCIYTYKHIHDIPCENSKTKRFAPIVPLALSKACKNSNPQPALIFGCVDWRTGT